MELRQLEYLATVAEEGSFTRAAEKLHVAQPGVSAQVRQLERELGQQLLDRGGRGVRPTVVGAVAIGHARAALEAVARLREAVDEHAGLVRGHVTVGMLASMAPSEIDLAGTLAGFHDDHPGVEITLTEGGSLELLEAVRDGRVDLAFAGMPPTTPAGIATRELVNERMVAAVGLDDELAGRRSLPLAALAERALICLPPGSGVRALLDDACARAGFEPRVAFEASDPRMLAQLAARSLGVAILPQSVAAAHGGLHAIDLTRPTIRGSVALAWRDGGARSPAAEALLEHMRRALTAAG